MPTRYSGRDVKQMVGYKTLELKGEAEATDNLGSYQNIIKATD